MNNEKKTAAGGPKDPEARLSRHAGAVEDLIRADVTNSPPVDPDELKKYRSGPKLSLPSWLKAALIKTWFAGMICYFFVWGLGNFGISTLDTVVIMGVVHGFVTDIITNNLFRYYAKTPGANDRWMMAPKKKYVSLPVNVVYSLILMFLVLRTYRAVNLLLGMTEESGVIVGVGPILFGVFTTAWDMLFLGCKRLIGRVVGDAMEEAGPAPGKRERRDYGLK